MLITRQETTVIPNNTDGKVFAIEYENRLREQSAFRGRTEDSLYITIKAEYYFTLLPEKKGESE